jgi:tetratricopeptide (TPR) repeat protein
MRLWKFTTPPLALSVIFLGGCASRSGQDSIDAADPVASSVLIKSSQQWGNGFLVDLKERLVVTTKHNLGPQAEVDVFFPVIDSGKAIAGKDEWLAKAKPKRVARGKVLISDGNRDLAVIQLAFIPEGTRDLLLAAASAKKDASVQFLGAGATDGFVWAPVANSTVQSVGEKEVALDGNRKATNQMVELDAGGEAAKGVAGGPIINGNGEVVAVIASPPSQTGGLLLCTDVSEVRAIVSAGYRVLAMHAYDAKKFDLALAYSERALAAWPEDALGYNERGAVYSQKDMFDKAIEDYSQAIKLESKLPVAWRNRGSAYYHLGKYKEAIKDLDEALKLSPEYLSALQRRSDVYAALKMTKEAEADKKKIASLSEGKWKTSSVKGGKDLPGPKSGASGGSGSGRDPDAPSSRYIQVRYGGGY